MWNLALEIAAAEEADAYVVSLAALLHDVGEWKLFDGDEAAGLEEVRGILLEHGVADRVMEDVLTIISEVSFMGGGTPRPMSSLEGRVVQDADRLDAIGAIGIARTFAFGGAKGRLIYNPEYEPRADPVADEYKAKNVDTISHFHEKLLLLKDLMNTNEGRRMAGVRHEVMVRFLADFADEWEQSHRHINDTAFIEE